MRFRPIVCFLSVYSWDVAAQQAATQPETPTERSFHIRGSPTGRIIVGSCTVRRCVGHRRTAGISQAENSDPGYGQGATGYAKRYGAQFADGTIENFMIKAILPSLLHQDPRNFQSRKRRNRAPDLVSRIFVTRTDGGRNQFNYSEILGAAAAAGISTSYYPRGDRDLSTAMTVWDTQVAYDALSFLAKEFWPDLRRRLHRSPSPQTP